MYCLQQCWILKGIIAVTICLCLKIETTWAEHYINQFAVHIEGGHHVASRVARETGFINLGQIGTLDDHYLFEAPTRERRSASPSHDHHSLLHAHDQVHWFEQQVAKSRKKRDFHPREVAQQMHIQDPDWDKQWYLNGGAYGGNDMNVIDAWRKGYTGKNIVVTILDDGLERDHPDIAKNYDPFASYDVNDHDNDPMPRYDPSNENRHGTRCAGEVSAEANNTHCTIGIAPDSKIGGIRMLDGEVFDAVEAASLSFNRSHIDIYSASWGPDDDGKVVDGPGKLAKKAFINGIQYGRGGKGSIYVWASGNGGSALDSCNCDGYANSIYTLSISSTSENGVKPWYLEECSSTLATTYSSGAYNERQIASTDLRKKCTTTHTGTSASAPLAAGIVALILEANPNLTWRDVQYITLMTARPGPIRDGQWITNGVGRQVSLRYGYGLMDATAMVNLALVWNNVPAKRECLINSSADKVALRDHQKYISKVETNGCLGTSTEVKYLEHVQARITLNYQRRGDVVIYLTSPSGTRSKLLPHRPNDLRAGGFDNWPFLSVQFWGENPAGGWTLEVEDGDEYGSRPGGGLLVSWSLVLHGTNVQPVKLKNQTTVTSGPPTSKKTSTTKPTGTTTVLKHEPCHPECVGGCTGPGPENCVHCKSYRTESTGTCVDKCPPAFYIGKDKSVCSPCDSSCATCSGPTLTECLTCPHLYQLHKVGKNQVVCFTDCLSGFFMKSKTCQPCDSSCKECGKSASECTSCKDGQTLSGSTCVSGSESKNSDGDVTEFVPMLVIFFFLMVLVVILIAASVAYAYHYGYLCWSNQKFYGQVPREDMDSIVRLTYSDSLDDEYN